MSYLTNPYMVTAGGLDDSQLKLYAKFNETSGDIINVSESSDSLGSSADLQVSGASYNQSESPFGYAMTFDGTNDNAKAGTSTSQFNFLHDSATMKWSMCFWANSTGGDGDGIILNRGDGGDDGGDGDRGGDAGNIADRGGADGNSGGGGDGGGGVQARPQRTSTTCGAKLPISGKRRRRNPMRVSAVRPSVGTLVYESPCCSRACFLSQHANSATICMP